MLNLGKGKDGQRVYFNQEKLEEAIKNPLSFKSKLNNQQWAKLRKYINKFNRGKI